MPKSTLLLSNLNSISVLIRSSFQPLSLDGYNVIDLDNRSLFSVLIYLNDCAQGGSTRLFHPDGASDPTRVYVQGMHNRSFFIIISIHGDTTHFITVSSR